MKPLCILFENQHVVPSQTKEGSLTHFWAHLYNPRRVPVIPLDIRYTRLSKHVNVLFAIDVVYKDSKYNKKLNGAYAQTWLREV